MRLSLYKGVGMYLTSVQEHSRETLDAGGVRKGSRKNHNRNRAAGPDHHDLAGLAGFSRHGGVWHHGANVQGRSDGAFAAVLVVEDEVPFFGVAIGAPPPSPRSSAFFVQGRRDVPN